MRMETVFWERFTAACAAKNTSPSAVVKALGLSSGSPTAWKRGTAPSMVTIARIAQLLEYPMDWFYGLPEQKEKAPTEGATDEEVKFALFGTTEVSDDLYERVKKMARIAAEMEAREKGG